MYVSGVVIVALSTTACAFARSYWELLVFRAVGGIGSTMFFRLGIGPDDPDEPHDARGRVAGMFSGAFLVGSVAGPVVGALTAGLGFAGPVPDLRRVADGRRGRCVGESASVALAAPASKDELTVTVAVALRHRAYRAALLSNLANGWSLFGLRFALVPCSSPRCSTAILARLGWR